MTDKQVIYNGVPMHPDWPAKIEAAQLVTHFVIGGQSFPRIRYGDEPGDWGADRQPCHDCGVVKGQFHVGPICDVEHCPSCGGQVISCECQYEGDEADV